LIKRSPMVSGSMLLGAGMDTFAYRQPSWAARLRILEIDHPESQKINREYLVKGGITVPANVEFLPIDFEHRSAGGGPRRVLTGPSSAHVLFVARGYAVSDQGSD
jgi:O-methyltransferase involved in polyketide biosynthesis